ncbi:MAG: KduI/IolB isomerase [Gemmatimonadetes bacterium]|nr:KduI/IolB isomerase [Gemmatimonadota bacterium]
MTMHFLPDVARTKTMSTDELRSSFLVQGLFREGEINLRRIDLDRVVLGGAVPTDAALTLGAPADLLAEYFCERRELGVLNIGASGKVTVDGVAHSLGKKDLVYVGRGSREVTFESDDARQPARFYLVSYPAHATHPTSRVSAGDVQSGELGSMEQANRRRIARYIHAGGIQSAQLVMGATTLEPGSVWNTMPAHTHDRRTEVYLYFDIPAGAVVFHQLGEPSETRHLIVRDGEVALSPGWSIHAGCGTASYAFCWAMGGENQDYADMQPVDVQSLR